MKDNKSQGVGDVLHGHQHRAASQWRPASYLGKLVAYQEIIANNGHKNWLGISSLFVLTITTSDTRLAEIIRRFGEGGGGSVFLFKAFSERELSAPAVHLLNEPWQRSGLQPLCADK